MKIQFLKCQLKCLIHHDLYLKQILAMILTQSHSDSERSGINEPNQFLNILL